KTLQDELAVGSSQRTKQRFGMAEGIEIGDGGFLRYDPAFYDRATADGLLAWLRRHVPWGQEKGHGRVCPRLSAWYSDKDLVYRYSGVEHVGSGWAPEVLQIKQRVEAASAATFNSLLLNLYRDGRDSIGFHADDEPELGNDPVVASLSFGAVRRF